MKKLIKTFILFIISKYTNKILIDKYEYDSLASENHELTVKVESLSDDSDPTLELQLDALWKINKELELELNRIKLKCLNLNVNIHEL